MSTAEIKNTVAVTNDPEKVDLRSFDISDEKRAELLVLFPEARTEGGKLDFDRLKLALGETVDVGKERYGMNWPGKADCFRTIQTPSVGTLRPVPEESVSFDTTENLIIEGDNLEVLKLLQKSYLGKIKMIYIDPPYNTGNDFIYPDNYTESLETYLEYTGQVDAEGKRFGTNTEADGRFHSKWMNMMYPRLYLARNLLREDGVVFISIGEQELSNLEKICNEVFGEENQISIVSRVAKSASDKGTFFAPSIDFVLCYSRTKEAVASFSDKVDESLYKKIEIAGPLKGERFRDDVALYQSALDTRPNQRYWIKCPDGSLVIPPGATFPPEQQDASKATPVKGDGVWRWSVETYLQNIHLLVFKETKTSPLLTPSKEQARWNIYTKSYLSERQKKGTRPRNFLDDVFNRKGADLLKKFGIEFDYSKPVELVAFLLDIVNPNPGDIVLDFFAGSGTTAHAVLDKANLGVPLNFVMVQLPEPLTEHEKAANPGCDTVADICKERIRKVISRLNEGRNGQLRLKEAAIIDHGFKTFKLAQSNFTAWNVESSKDPASLATQLDLHVDHIRQQRTDDDILYELLLKSGFSLTTPVEKKTVKGKTIYSVASGAFVICLDRALTLELIRAIADMKPERVVCLDEGFVGNDQLKTNAVQTFKTKGITSFKTV